jgi:PleD family two-component response regulator
MEQTPVVFLTDQAELHHRILASYITPSQLLSQPLRKQAWLDALHRLTGHTTIRRARILLLEDEGGFAQKIAEALSQAGFAVHTLPSALSLLEALEEITPDLLFLSLSVPGFSGLDLCRMLRANPRWSDLQIIMLAPLMERALRTLTLQLGVHDIITQSTSREELIPLIKLRLQRTQLLEQQRYRDPATSLLTRHAFLERATAALAEAQETQRPLSLCLFRFQAWEDIAKAHGFAARTSALILLAQALQAQTRRFDLLGRLDEQTLALALPSPPHDLNPLLQHIHQAFYQHPPSGSDLQPFFPPFHWGIAHLSDESQTIDALLDIAFQPILTQ